METPSLKMECILRERERERRRKRKGKRRERNREGEERGGEGREESKGNAEIKRSNISLTPYLSQL